MKSGRRQSKGKLVKPTFFVFCEGETEETYIKYLRSSYRLPIEIVIKIKGSDINKRFIDRYKKEKTIHPKDKTFLMYDCDVPEIVDKLRKIHKVDLLLSNPCFEVWYLLHFQDQKAEISSEECVRKLSNHLKNYRKGILTDDWKQKLNDRQEKAIIRAKTLEYLKNPSTEIFRLIEELKEIIS